MSGQERGVSEELVDKSEELVDKSEEFRGQKSVWSEGGVNAE